MNPRASAKFATCSFVLLSLALTANATEPASGIRHLKRETKNIATINVTPTPPAVSLPPLPEGVAELKFQDLFKTPIGNRGLETTSSLESLNGRRVRVVGYMVRENPADADEPATEDASAPVVNGPVTDRFLLTPSPQITNYAHYGLCEDLPPQTIYVTLANAQNAPVAFTPGPLLLTGVLSVGIQTELDGRTSVVRLKLDPASPSATTASAGRP